MNIVGSINDIKQQVVFALLQRQELISCLTDSTTTVDHGNSLINRNVFKWFYIPDKPDTTKAYITMRAKITKVKDSEDAIVLLDIGVFAHKEYMPYKSGARVDFIAEQVQDILHKYAFIDGNDYSVFNLVDMDHFYPQFQYDGYMMTYIVKLLNFNKCKEYYGQN